MNMMILNILKMNPIFQVSFDTLAPINYDFIDLYTAKENPKNETTHIYVQEGSCK
jgi:hypothetical protein